jgi:hypothetical protein
MKNATTTITTTTNASMIPPTTHAERTSRPLTLAFAFGMAATLALAAGCGESKAAPSLSSTPGPTDNPEPAPEKPVRTVEQRSPFGRLTPSNNLLADGDFEFTGRSMQMPWITFADNGQGVLNYATGGRCRSGIRCARLDAGAEMVGFVASPKTAGMRISIWGKPDSGACDDVTVRLIDLESPSVSSAVAAEAKAPDASGWCRYTGEAPNLAGGAPALYVTTNRRGTSGALVDDGVIEPASESGVATVRRFESSSAALAERVRFVADWIRTHRQYGIPREAPLEGKPRRDR